MNIGKVLMDLGERAIVTCRRDTPVAEAIALLARHRIGAMPVEDAAGAVAGVFSERDVITCLGQEAAGTSGACLARPVGEAMTAPAITVTRRTELLDALALMTRRRIRHLPVLAGDGKGDLVGFVSIGDLVKARLEEIQYEASALRDYIQTA